MEFLASNNVGESSNKEIKELSVIGNHFSAWNNNNRDGGNTARNRLSGRANSMPDAVVEARAAGTRDLGRPELIDIESDFEAQE